MTNKIRNNYEQLANTFWKSAGEYRNFPRNIEQAILWVFPLAIIKLPRLGLASIRRWLEARDLGMPYSGTERRIRACLLARCGNGIIFIDGADPEDERRFSLAHEIAHYLLDYHIKRQEIIKVLGCQIVEVLDGKREATIEERLTGILSGMTVGPFMHLMDRDKRGNIDGRFILDVEDAVERFALELTAPRRVTERFLDQYFPGWFNHDNQANAVTLSVSEYFGIPQRILSAYISYLAFIRRPRQSFKEWLGWPTSEC